MNNRKAFTMVELIFVIVILGILSGVALPRFLAMSDESHCSVCDSAIGTMNRTVGLNLWSKSLSEGKNGDINLTQAEIDKNIPTYNVAECGNIIDLNVGDPAAADGEFGSPVMVNDGNMTNAPVWRWVKK